MSKRERLDLTGLDCPHVAVRTKRVLATMPRGSELTVLTDDPLAPVDLQMMVSGLGHELRAIEEIGGAFVVTIRVAVQRPDAAGKWPMTK